MAVQAHHMSASLMVSDWAFAGQQASPATSTHAIRAAGVMLSRCRKTRSMSAAPITKASAGDCWWSLIVQRFPPKIQALVHHRPSHEDKQRGEDDEDDGAERIETHDAGSHATGRRSDKPHADGYRQEPGAAVLEA